MLRTGQIQFQRGRSGACTRWTVSGRRRYGFRESDWKRSLLTVGDLESTGTRNDRCKVTDDLERKPRRKAGRGDDLAFQR